MIASSDDSTIDAICCIAELVALAVGEIDQHVYGADHRARCIVDRRRKRHERHAHAVGALRDGFSAANRPPFLNRLRHRALIAGQCPAIRPEQLPRAAPLALAQRRAAAPKLRGRFVEIGDPAGGIRGVDGGGKGIEELAEKVLAPGRRFLDQRRYKIGRHRGSPRSNGSFNIGDVGHASSPSRRPCDSTRGTARGPISYISELAGNLTPG